MQAEIEVRFLSVDHDELREKLRAVGGVCEYPMRLMKRAIIDYPDRRMQIGRAENWGWIRVRDEGDRITLTYKQVAKNENRDTHEIEFNVSSYENAVALFEAIGLKKHAEQQTKRETWKLQDCEVVLDEWPWLAPMVEIEGPSEVSLQAVAARLGFDWHDAMRGNAEDVYYKAYPGIRKGESLSDMPQLNFDEMPEWLKQRQRA